MAQYFYKNKATDKIWWVDQIDNVLDGHMMFSFDKKKIYYLFRDYPSALSSEEKAIFDKENPYWRKFFDGEES